MNFTNYWVPESLADMAALRTQHDKAFPGNELAVVGGYVKVAVIDGDTVPANAITTDQVRIEWAKLPQPSI